MRAMYLRPQNRAQYAGSMDVDRCKLCNTQTETKDRRNLKSQTSSVVKLYLVKNVCQHGGIKEEEAVMHFQVGYLGKKCFVLVQKCEKLESDLQRTRSEVLEKISELLKEQQISVDHSKSISQDPQQQASASRKRSASCVYKPPAKRLNFEQSTTSSPVVTVSS